ncbi:MAG: universal stress protein [Candidatus Thermoplasmatota archaeon]|nr:universal stress protein [Candidatus Thermoplasmatota archaeon]
MEESKKNSATKVFNRIIVALDGSDAAKKALRYAIPIAKKVELPLLSIYVIDLNIYAENIMSDQVSNQMRSILRNEGESVLNNAKKIGDDNGLVIQTRLLQGTPSEEIVNLSDKNDLIVMGSKGKSRLKKVLIGSVSENVLHHAECNVIIVR